MHETEVLTLLFSTCKDGRADGYSNKMMLTPTPTRIPYSTPSVRHSRNVAKAGIKSLPNNRPEKYITV